MTAETRIEGIRAIGHRGAMADRIENTIPAFHEAIRQGATALELDLRRAGSGELIVFHDADPGRLGGAPLPVAEMTLRRIREIDLTDPLLPGQTGRVPTFEELLADPLIAGLLQDRDRPFDLIAEIKADGIEADLADLLKARGLVDRVMACSFRPDHLERLRTLCPALRTSLLFARERERKLRLALDLGLTAVNPEPYDADPDFVDRARGAGLLVTVGQTCDPATIRRLLDLDVWGIHSDRPRLVVEARRERMPP